MYFLNALYTLPTMHFHIYARYLEYVQQEREGYSN
jgi:hypothetical protein